MPFPVQAQDLYDDRGEIVGGSHSLERAPNEPLRGRQSRAETASMLALAP